MSVIYDRVALIGLGLIASSMFWAMKRDGLAREVTGYARSEALTRARVLYYMQVGYDFAQLGESIEDRIARVPEYLLVFTGQQPLPGETEEFASYARRIWAAQEEDTP